MEEFASKEIETFCTDTDGVNKELEDSIKRIIDPFFETEMGEDEEVQDFDEIGEIEKFIYDLSLDQYSPTASGLGKRDRNGV